MRNVVFVLLLLAYAAAGLAQEIVCFEAETAEQVCVPMQVGPDAGAKPNSKWPPAKDGSGGGYLEVPEGKGNPPKVTTGEATCSFLVTHPGAYALWARVWWLDECGNSLTMSLDDNRPFTFGQDATYKRWHWVKAPKSLRNLSLAAGKHVLKIKNREDGVRIDQILLSSDKRYVPVGIEDVTETAADGH